MLTAKTSEPAPIRVDFLPVDAVPLRAMPTVRVEAQTSAKTYEVNLVKRTCTCSTPEGPCFHVLKARDIHSEGCKRSRFEIVSALHKEIRRGDVAAALYWADLLSKYSDGYVKNYARRIVGDPKQLPPSFAGREFDGALLDELPASVDPCGERGEFHTFAYDGPMFQRPIALRSGEVVERDGVVFADLIPGSH